MKRVLESVFPEEDRVRSSTSKAIQQALDEQTVERVQSLGSADDEAISRRISELRREWDVERWLEMNASGLALTGLVLGIVVDRRFLAIPGIVLPFLLQHALQGWCPPLPLFRRLGIRSRQEIERERFALKALRKDFDGLDDVEDARGSRAWIASGK